MTVLRTSGVLPATDNPVPSADKKVAAWHANPQPETLVVPGLDAATLSRRYGMAAASAPQLETMTFRIPVPCQKDAYLRVRDLKVSLWIDAKSKQGWDWVRSGRRDWNGKAVQVLPGPYPARDLDDANTEQWDQREMQAFAYFRFRNPKPVRLEVPASWLESVQAAHGIGSSS